jgi:hypothetical protein
MTCTRSAARCAIATSFIAVFLGLGVGAVLAAPALAMVIVALISLAAVVGIGLVELLPALESLRAARAAGAAIRRLCRSLDRLPETPHPLGL